MKRSVFVGVLLLTFACIAAHPWEKVIVLDQEFRLKVGESAKASAEGLNVEFDSVVEDSRCPKGVSCIWAGNAKVLLKVKTEGGKQADVALNTNANPKSSRYLDYELSLKELKPYPEGDVKIKS